MTGAGAGRRVLAANAVTRLVPGRLGATDSCTRTSPAFAVSAEGWNTGGRENCGPRAGSVAASAAPRPITTAPRAASRPSELAWRGQVLGADVPMTVAEARATCRSS